jgi:hypothetical protein
VSGLIGIVFVYRCVFKKAAPLLNCTDVEQRAVIRFLFKKRPKHVTTPEIYRRMLAQ